MAITCDVIWGFREDILEVRNRFKEYVWLAHLSQPWGIPLHKYKRKVTLDENKIAFSGKAKTQNSLLNLLSPVKRSWKFILGGMMSSECGMIQEH